MFDPLEFTEEFALLRRHLKEASAIAAATGCMEGQKEQLTARLAKDYGWVLYVTPDETAAQAAAGNLKNFSDNVFQFPARDLLFYNSDTQGKFIENQRTWALRKLLEEERGILVAPSDALMDKLPPLSELENMKIRLMEGREADFSGLVKRLSSYGYERAAQVETYGQFAVRGGIMDIYPMAAEAPVRIELFGDEIDTIRTFDRQSQRSLERIKYADIYPASSGGGAEKVSLTGYFGGYSLTVLDNPEKIKAHLGAVEAEFAESFENRKKSGLSDIPEYGVSDIFPAVSALKEALSGRTLLFSDFDSPLKEFNAGKSFNFHTAAPASYSENFSLLISDLKKYAGSGYRVSLATPSRTRASRLAEDLRGYGIRAFCPDEGREGVLKPGETEVVCGFLSRGFSYPDIKYVLLTEADMFGSARNRRRKKKRQEGKALTSLGQLSPGDYVVHEDHGIGIYRGVQHIIRNDIGRDYLEIEYADKGRLFLPASKLDLLQKYQGADGHVPKLNSLNGSEWKKTRQRVAGSVKDIAADLVKLYAERLNAKGYSFSPDTVWQKEFEELFPYEETADQQAAIEAVKADMESGRPMDRLICGDVGFGKTEIALRAAFKAVQDGKQAAVLVPTTVLAQQHYNTFKERLGRFPVETAVMSRFRSVQENKKTAEGLKSGKVDIVIGTHRLLSKDVAFKDLGLLVIDEEQRFGVADKEKIKKLKANVDVLTLTATPIPRTLHMSLSGIRDLSLLDEPPFDRMPIQTYVMEYNDEFVREAAKREVSRNGQVFYIYNRVGGIEEKCLKLRSMLPGARIEYAHGRMPESELEEIMYDFSEGRIDVLVSTTIVENGLDIPNANTLIVDGAEHMGLSQLYQLRGRVGRSSRTAYAFFMYRKDRILGEEAEKRLKAIKEFTGFGAGVRIAMRDLEIRGAGNVLGAEQHGQMQAVGYDLYCKLLKRAVGEARGAAEYAPGFTTSAEVDIDAFIPADYISDEAQKLDVYKRISEILGEDDCRDITDELIDRYGDIPKEVNALMDIALLRAAAHRAYVTELRIKENTFTMAMYPRADINVGAIPGIIKDEKGCLRFSPGEKPFFTYRAPRGKSMPAEKLMEKAGEIIGRLSGTC